jgi:hypothetical protein
VRISETKASEVYAAISDPITDLRIKQNRGMTIEEMDERLFNLQSEIWRKVHKALNLETNP